MCIRDSRTPMNAIIGITTLMKSELHEPEKLAEHLGKLEKMCIRDR